jgi:hypothetical protein
MGNLTVKELSDTVDSLLQDHRDIRSKLEGMTYEIRSLKEELTTFKRYGLILVVVFLLGDKGGNILVDKLHPESVIGGITKQ